jgi:U3 small nucleolar RNA-associated protein 10
MMPVIVDVLAARDAFASDAAYLEFAEGPVASCLAALARAIARDVLWKPLNHKLLLLTRDSSRNAVRIGAVKVLHKLFQDVGEEYLLLLPECLPFLSELLEDDAEEVTQCTGELIRYIEELSGEKLDTYLQ